MTTMFYADQPQTEPALTRSVVIRWEAAVYLVILVLAIFTRFYTLGDRVMSHDESLHTKFSYDLYAQGIYRHTPLMHGPILFHVTALMYTLFGHDDFTARIYPAVLGVLMVMFPLLFRRWLGRWGAILAAVMILISPLLLYYNRYIREDTPSIFYSMIMVYCTFMYLDGPDNQRRKARWLYIFSAAMLASMASKESAFIYIAIFGSFLTLYWAVRLVQYFFGLPGRTLMYFAAMAVLLAGVISLAMYVVLSIAPLDTATTLGPESQGYVSLVTWTALVAITALALIVGTLLWVYRREVRRIPWLDVLLLVAMIVVVCAFMIYIEERSHITPASDTQPSAPAIPGQEEVAQPTFTSFNPLPIYATWVICGVLIALLIYSARAGWWHTLHRFPELDVLMLMGTLVLPWLSPFITAFTGITPAEYTAIGTAAPELLKSIVQGQSAEAIGKTYLALQVIIPFFALSIVAGLVWSWRRWLVASAIYHILFVFFYTTMFTNMPDGLAGVYSSLDYWLEQQKVRRGNQPQYYYLVLIMPFYEFLPIIGSAAAMIAGTALFWRFRKGRRDEYPRQLEAQGDAAAPDDPAPAAVEIAPLGTAAAPADQPDAPRPGDILVEKPKRKPKPALGRRGKLSRVPEAERLVSVSFLLFVSWWAIFNHIAYTLAGEKMPWLGTHLTLPLILLAAWFFGRLIERVEWPVFRRRGWLYLLLFPLLLVALAQVVGPLLTGTLFGGLQQAQLARTYQGIAGLAIAVITLVVLFRLAQATGWGQFRAMLAVGVFILLGFVTFRSAWMAAFINYDLATEYLVYAHGAPANKRVTEQLEEWSKRITGGMDIKFAYDYRISWPGAWYFRSFKNAVYLGENPSPRLLEDTVAVIVGDENRAAVEAALEDRYFRFDYLRLWWPMQDYFGLTPQRVLNVLDFSPQNIQAQQIRQGLFDIWWWRDYTRYGEAVGKSFKITSWPVADRMYVFVRKDVASQIWTLGVGDGTALNPLNTVEVNLCTQNWLPLQAVQVIGSPGVQPGQINHARQIAVGADGKIYVAEEFNHRISVFNPDGTLAFTFGQQGAGSDGAFFERPNGVAVAPDGRIIVADTWNYRVQTFTADGRRTAGWGQRGEYGIAAQPQPVDAFWGPRAVVVDDRGFIYVADTGNKRVRVYSADGQYMWDIGGGGSGNGQLDEPTGLAISADGLLYVADTWNRRISVFNLDGTPANRFNKADGSVSNNFRVRAWFDDLGNRPYLAIDAARGYLYVTDPDAGRVLVYDLNGNCVGAFGQLNRETPDLTQFASIGGIAVDGAGFVYVADAGSGRILKFAPYQPPAPVNAGAADPAVQPGIGQPETTQEVEATPEVTEASG